MKKKILLISIFLVKCVTANAQSLELSEIGFKDKTSDWIEIKINSKPKNTLFIKDDSKITEINPKDINDEKYILIHFKSDQSDKETENGIMHIYTTKKGLTGTTEQITITENDKIIDAMCWKNLNPTESELKDLNDLMSAKILKEECINSENVNKNESIAKMDESWKILKHPTPGKTNEFTNTAPKAVITIQTKEFIGQSAITKEIPFSINLDGSASYDPDGDQLRYKWIFPTKIMESKNPSSYRFEKSGKYEINLTVSDEFNKSDTTSLKIHAKIKTSESKSKKLIEQIIQNQKKTNLQNEKANENWIFYLIGTSMFFTLTAILTFKKTESR